MTGTVPADVSWLLSEQCLPWRAWSHAYGHSSDVKYLLHRSQNTGLTSLVYTPTNHHLPAAICPTIAVTSVECSNMG